MSVFKIDYFDYGARPPIYGLFALGATRNGFLDWKLVERCPSLEVARDRLREHIASGEARDTRTVLPALPIYGCIKEKQV